MSYEQGERLGELGSSPRSDILPLEGEKPSKVSRSWLAEAGALLFWATVLHCLKVKSAARTSQP